MGRRLWVGILTVLLTGGVSAAQPRVVRRPTGIRWVAGIEEARITARITDAPVIVYVCLSNHAACLNFEEEVLAHRTFRKLSGLFVMVRVDARRRKDVAQAFQITRYPTLLFLDSAGERLYTLDSQMTANRVVQYMVRTFLVSMFNSGRRAREAGEVRTAVRRFKTLIAIGQGTPPAQWAERELKRIDADGVKKLSQARIALDAKDYLTAMTLLDDLVYHWRATQTGIDARKLMDELAADVKAAEALTEARRRRDADRKLARARKLEEQGDVEGALIVYWDVVRDYAQTPAAEAAGKRADELVAADRPLALRAAKTRMTRDCTLWMEMALAFEQNKKKDSAIVYYQRVIAYYPGTSWAKKAQDATHRLLGVQPAE
ncbi:MAG TPA: tetratricopeptide repeat protein [Planctomycetota bacterium]|nr:tetratricopeptide repeat protein [Planctomycetota bacterium]